MNISVLTNYPNMIISDLSPMPTHMFWSQGEIANVLASKHHVNIYSREVFDAFLSTIIDQSDIIIVLLDEPTITKTKEIRDKTDKPIVGIITEPYHMAGIGLWPANIQKDFLYVISSLDAITSTVHSIKLFLKIIENYFDIDLPLPIGPLRNTIEPTEKKGAVLINPYGAPGTFETVKLLKSLSIKTTVITEATNVDEAKFILGDGIEVVPRMPQEDHLSFINSRKFCIQMSPAPGLGTAIYKAAISNTVSVATPYYWQEQLFPSTTIDIYDYKTCIDMLGDLLNDNDYYNSIVESANSKLLTHDIESSEYRDKVCDLFESFVTGQSDNSKC